MMRSMLFVRVTVRGSWPRPRRRRRRPVLDLEDAVLPERKSLARAMMQSWLAAQSDRTNLWVRVNDLASGELLKTSRT